MMENNELQEYLNEGLVWNKDNIIGIFGMKILKLGFVYLVAECRDSFIKFADHMEYYRVKKDTLNAINKMFSRGYKDFDPIIRTSIKIDWKDRDLKEAAENLDENAILTAMKIFNVTMKILNAVNKIYPITNLIYRLLTLSGAPSHYFKENKKVAVGTILWLLLISGKFNDIAEGYGVEIIVSTKMDTILKTTASYREYLKNKEAIDKQASIENGDDAETDDDVKKRFEDDEKEEEFEEILRKHKEELDKSNKEIDKVVKKNKELASNLTANVKKPRVNSYTEKYLRNKVHAKRK